MTLETLRVASWEEIPTSKMRLLPLLTVCDQVLLETLVPVTQVALTLPTLACGVTVVTTMAPDAEPLLFEASGS